ncbi:hypothetical protein EB796_000341 [Bugula neritina]|uniref:PAS domain-containing protein n=1 Tax=Bugula neritina TaxID=10212 RepID=A0A7J7KT92_BUGNE|nr:hypothetical protein EB796_000341 [Bugula neritina]
MGCAPSAVNVSRKPASKVVAPEEPQTKGEGDQSEGGREPSDLQLISKEADYSMFYGKMKFRSNSMTILLVFGKEDAQCEAFRKAADKGNYQTTLTKTPESAIESFAENQQDLVIIDCRHSKHFDAVKLCKTLKERHPRGHSRFLALTNKCDKDEPSVLPLLNAGFSRRLVENTNITSCYNELLSIDHSELEYRSHQQVQTSAAMYHALNHVSESIEITDSKFRTEFVNRLWEKQTGYSSKEVIGTEFQDKLQVDNCNEEQTLVYHAKKNQIWEGQQSIRRKNGDIIRCKCRIIPMMSNSNTASRYILVRQTVDGYSQWDRLKDIDSKTHDKIVRSQIRRDSYFSLTSSEASLQSLQKYERTLLNELDGATLINNVDGYHASILFHNFSLINHHTTSNT